MVIRRAHRSKSSGIANGPLLKTGRPVNTMRVVVEPGGIDCLNMGDVAMMQVACERLRALWPQAEIGVVTSSPDLLARFCPSAAPLSAEARNAWLSGRCLLGGLHGKLPAKISSFLQKLETQFWLRLPLAAELGVRLKARIKRRTAPSPSSFRKILAGAGLVVVTGAGMLNDAFADSAVPLLHELEFALRSGIPVIAFGQGVGPITDPELLAKARAVLPRLALISLRENRMGLPMLESLGVSRDRIYVTGDDAIELAYQNRPHSVGSGIGINLRIADYAGTGSEMADELRKPLQCAVQSLYSFLTPVPISLHSADSDTASISRVLGIQEESAPAAIESPVDVIHRIGGCRVVVTGSYHGGVFALAQGIPVVGLVRSPYYEQKFLGLQQQFPGGCRILDFRQPVTPAQIQDAIRAAWESAPRVREPLLAAAIRQIESARAAYKAAHQICAPETW
jgi:colanic acid/amylovoran biosynthesis protein